MSDPDRPELREGPDLEALRRSEPPARAPRPWLARATVALLVLGGLGVAYGLLRPVLLSPARVRLAPVTLVGGDAEALDVVVEAAGWLEADPYPITVRPLVAGVVDRLLVLEGQEVVRGETRIAVLRNPELESARRLARADLDLREAEVGEAEARLETRRDLLEQRLDWHRTVARLEGEAAAAAEAVAVEEADRDRAERSLETARLDHEAILRLEGAGSQSPLARERARARVAEAEAELEAAHRRVARARAEHERAQRLAELARQGRDAPVALEGAVREAERAVARAQAAREAARVRLEVAETNVSLLDVLAPADGVVLRLECAPGSAAGPQGRSVASVEQGTGSSGQLGHASGALVTLYDPARLQARVDVQQDQVGGIGSGTPAEIEASAVPGRVFRGAVTRVQHEADLRKNTLQVKVRVEEPDPRLRPEMLVRARFLVQRAEGDGPAASRLVRVPAEALRGDAVYVFDPRGGGRARRVVVVVRRRDADGAVVEGPLGPGHRVILDPVEDGQTVREAP